VVRKVERRARYKAADVARWRRDGAILIPGFFTPEEVAAVKADFDALFARRGADEPMVKAKEGELGRFNPAQFTGVQSIPLDCSPALNLMGVHPALIAFAKEALETDDVHLYQCQAWAKFTGEADYNQPFHCDFVNHTLTAPSDDQRLNSVTCILIISDVTEEHGPTHFVTRTDSLPLAGPEATLRPNPELQERLAERARSAAGPAGSLFVYGIDIWHRGTNLVAPGGHRYVMTVTYRRADNGMIDFRAWPYHHLQPWRIIFENATPEQLACFGVRRPGDPYWTPLTLARTEARWPGWDSRLWRAALPRAAAAAE
jgi:hypothetical protein